MGSSYLPPPEQNVVNVGDELSQSALDAINAASFPSGTNPFRTMNDAGGGSGGGISSYDNFKVYQQGDLVIAADKLYRFNSYIGAAGYGPITHPSAWTEISASPGFNDAALTGNPTAPTPAAGDNDTSIATTAFVKVQNYAKLGQSVQFNVVTGAAGTFPELTGSVGNPGDTASTYRNYTINSYGFSGAHQTRTENTAEEGMGDNSYIELSKVGSLDAYNGILTLGNTQYEYGEFTTSDKNIILSLSSMSLFIGDTTGNTPSFTLSPDNGLAFSGGLSVTPTGIVFPDASVQTTAAVTFDPTGYATESWVSSQSYAQVSSVESHTGGSDSHDIIVTIGGVDYRIAARLV